MRSYSFALAFDEDLDDELDLVSVTPVLNGPMFTTLLPQGPNTESTGSVAGLLESIGALGSCTPCAQDESFLAATIDFQIASSPMADDPELRVSLDAAVDDFLDGANAAIGAVLLGTASVDPLSPADADSDGVPDVSDNCPNDPNPGQEDTDGNGTGDACNDAEDGDGDEWADVLDNCPATSNTGQEDGDGDGVGDACDNCPTLMNPGQEDTDMNGTGDACEDADADGVFDSQDNCLIEPNVNQIDVDQDGFGNLCDADLSNDLVVSLADFGLLVDVFGTNDPLADLNSDGVVSIADVAILSEFFGAPPGPSGYVCAGSVPCP